MSESELDEELSSELDESSQAARARGRLLVDQVLRHRLVHVGVRLELEQQVDEIHQEQDL